MSVCRFADGTVATVVGTEGDEPYVPTEKDLLESQVRSMVAQARHDEQNDNLVSTYTFTNAGLAPEAWRAQVTVMLKRYTSVMVEVYESGAVFLRGGQRR